MWRQFYLLLLLLLISLATGCDSAKKAVSQVGAAAKKAANDAGAAVSGKAKEVAKTVAQKSSDAIDAAKQTTAEAVGAAGSVTLNIGAPVAINRCEATFVPPIDGRPAALQFRTGAANEEQAPAVFVHAAVQASDLQSLDNQEVQARMFVVGEDGALWDNTDLELATLHLHMEDGELKAELRSGQLRNTQSGATTAVSGSLAGVVPN